jgi:hypothetical protein
MVADDGRPAGERPAEEQGAMVGGRQVSEFEAGFLVGLLVGEGHFGGDGRQPQVTLRMHTDHVAVFEWLLEHVPGGRLYGPYHHSGRRYYQWMARGRYVRDDLLPLLDRYLQPELSGRVYARFVEMKRRYRLGAPAAVDQTGGSPAVDQAV